LTERLIVACVDALGQGRRLPYGEHIIDFTPPWQRARYADLFREHVGVAMDDREGVRRRALETKIPLELRDEKTKVATPKEHDVLVHELFEHHVEHKLTERVFVHDYPAALCPLTKRKRGDPSTAERFELYVRRMELANAYTELNEPI